MARNPASSTRSKLKRNVNIPKPGNSATQQASTRENTIKGVLGKGELASEVSPKSMQRAISQERHIQNEEGSAERFSNEELRKAQSRLNKAKSRTK